jgi:hypothetical protein
MQRHGQKWYGTDRNGIRLNDLGTKAAAGKLLSDLPNMPVPDTHT